MHGVILAHYWKRLKILFKNYTERTFTNQQAPIQQTAEK
jgi:hypothetical protein